MSECICGVRDNMRGPEHHPNCPRRDPHPDPHPCPKCKSLSEELETSREALGILEREHEAANKRIGELEELLRTAYHGVYPYGRAAWETEVSDALVPKETP